METMTRSQTIRLAVDDTEPTPAAWQAFPDYALVLESTADKRACLVSVRPEVALGPGRFVVKVTNALNQPRYWTLGVTEDPPTQRDVGPPSSAFSNYEEACKAAYEELIPLQTAFAATINQVPMPPPDELLPAAVEQAVPVVAEAATDSPWEC